MCNCNKRSTSSTTNSKRPVQNVAVGNMVKVQLVENYPLVFYGSFTGRAYRLKNLYDVVWVDPRDALNLAGLRGVQVVN